MKSLGPYICEARWIAKTKYGNIEFNANKHYQFLVVTIPNPKIIQAEIEDWKDKYDQYVTNGSWTDAEWKRSMKSSEESLKRAKKKEPGYALKTNSLRSAEREVQKWKMATGIGGHKHFNEVFIVEVEPK